MAQIRFANNVSTQLTKPVAADDSTIEVRSLIQGLTWPNISATGDYFLIVIDDISSSTWEIMKCTKVQVNGNETVLTVERGLEGTTATTFQAGSVVENRLTAGTLDTFGAGFPAKVEINRGGTGATTAAQARTNLGVPSKADLSSEVNTRISEVARLDKKIETSTPPSATTSVRGITILSNAIDSASEAMAATPKAVKTAYDDLNNKILSVPDVDAKTIIEKDGKVIAKDIAIDGDITDLASERGIFNSKLKDSLDYDTLIQQGFYTAYFSGSTNGPDGARRILVLSDNKNNNDAIQIAVTNRPPTLNKLSLDIRACSPDTGWTEWKKFISETDKASTSTPGIVQLNSAVNSASETLAATSKAVKTAYDKAAAAASKSATAGKLATARSITLTGPVTGTVNFDGSANVSIPTSVTSASTSAKGIVQLSSATNSKSEAVAATSKAVKAAYDKAVEAHSKAGLPLGHIFAWPFSTAPDGCIILNGSTYDRTLYADFFAYIKSKGWTKTDAEWQDIAQANNGFCPWYSEGDGSTNFRTPKFAPYMKVTLLTDSVGKYYEAGLPDHTHTYTRYSSKRDCAWADGTAIFWQSDKTQSSGKASASNSIYGNSTTVQPESHDWIICAVAIGAVTNIGSVDIADVISTVNQMQTKVTEAKEIDSSGYASSQHWVRYTDGRQIIYSDWGSDFSNTSAITFAKPFTTNPALMGFDSETISANSERRAKFADITATYFKINDWAYGSATKSGCWVAMGTWK